MSRFLPLTGNVKNSIKRRRLRAETVPEEKLLSCSQSKFKFKFGKSKTNFKPQIGTTANLEKAKKETALSREEQMPPSI